MASNKLYMHERGNFNVINGNNKSIHPLFDSYFRLLGNALQWHVKIDSKSDNTEILSSSLLPNLAKNLKIN